MRDYLFTYTYVCSGEKHSLFSPFSFSTDSAAINFAESEVDRIRNDDDLANEFVKIIVHRKLRNNWIFVCDAS